MTTGLEEVGNEVIGMDPRQMQLSEIKELGHKRVSPMKAIRLRCLDCCNQQQSEVRKCTAVKCVLWPFRMGKNIWFGSGKVDDEEGCVDE